MILYTLGGGVDGAGGLSILAASSEKINYQTDAVLLDCGKRAFKDKPNQTIPRFSTALNVIESQSSIKAIIISHAHIDHFGALPDAATFAPFAPIYVPEGSKQLISLQLRKKMLFSSWYEEDVSIDDAMTRAIELIIARIQEIPYYQGFYVPNSSFYFEFIPAGHIMGSAMIFLKQKEQSLLFSGDFFPSNVLSMRPLDFDYLSKKQIDVFLCETTMLSKSKKYDCSANKQEVRELSHLSDFKKVVDHLIENSDDCMVLTSAVGIAQELISCLLKEFAKPSRTIRVILDEANYEVTNLYLSSKNKCFGQIVENANSQFLELSEFFNRLAHGRLHSKSTASQQILNAFFVSPHTVKKNRNLRQYFFPKDRNTLILSYSPTELRIDKDINSDSEKKQHLTSILNVSDSDSFECDVKYVPCFMHPEYFAIKEIIQKTKPNYVYFMHGFIDDSIMSSLKRELSQSELDNEIFFTPLKNHVKYGEIKNENE